MNFDFATQRVGTEASRGRAMTQRSCFAHEGIHRDVHRTATYDGGVCLLHPDFTSASNQNLAASLCEELPLDVGRKSPSWIIVTGQRLGILRNTACFARAVAQLLIVYNIPCQRRSATLHPTSISLRGRLFPFMQFLGPSADKSRFRLCG